jgi:hypothetical protein
MNGNTPPVHFAAEVGNTNHDHVAVAKQQTSPPPPNVAALSSDKASHEPVADRDDAVKDDAGAANGGDDNASEAETLIDSPVKKKQLQQQQKIEQRAPVDEIKVERVPKQLHRIGSLPVPTSGDDEDDSAAVSPAPSTPVSVEKVALGDLPDQDKDHDMEDADGAGSVNDYDSNSLSSPRSYSPGESLDDSVNRAFSEQADSTRNGNHFANPRKRKHRASSVSLPNKRPSLNAPKTRVSGLNLEDVHRSGQSLSPKLRNHRRAASTQSAYFEGTGDPMNRKRRANTQQPGKDYKQPRAAWEESDASSETTSHGQGEFRRPQRGIGRSTSTPGRPPGREHKRHVNKYGFTRLAEACEEGNMDQVRAWREKDPDQLELAEFAGNTPLQIAALNGNVEVVDYLIEQGCQIDCANVDKDTPLIDAAENGHLDVVHSLLRAGVDPLKQNQRGQQALDVVTDDVDDAIEIRSAIRKAIDDWNSNGAKEKREHEEEMRHRAGPSKELHFMARTYENLLKLVQNNDRNGVKEFLDARVPVDNTVIAAAARTGDIYLVNMLLAEMAEKKAAQKPERPMLSVLGTSHFEMVKSLTELENFNPLYRNRQGQTWPELAKERHGPNWRQELDLLQRLYDSRAALKERRSSSPVTKRESGKRRPAQPAADDDSDDSEEEAAPPRNNGGRRLMSRKAMRANGKGTSDASSDDESNNEMPTAIQVGEDSSMKPPESPNSKRTSPRSRTKSFSVATSDTSPRTRRRSSSVRAAADNPLPILVETAEDKELILKREEEERQAAEEAQRLEEERLDFEKAEAEAAANRAAEEKARKAEEERLAEEARQAEEARLAEEARKAEEARIHTENEIAKAELAHRDEVMASLPTWISQALRPGPACSLGYLLCHVMPLQIVKEDWQTMLQDDIDIHSWVLNVTAAPLLGHRGVELMLQSGSPGHRGSLADEWTMREIAPDECETLIKRLSVMHYEHPDGPIPKDEHGNSTLSFEEECQRAQGCENERLATKQRLRTGQAVLRYVRLRDVLDNLCPTLKGVRIPVDFSCLQPRAMDQNGQTHIKNYVDNLGANVGRLMRPRVYIDGVCINEQAASTWQSMTTVRPVYSK